MTRVTRMRTSSLAPTTNKMKSPKQTRVTRARLSFCQGSRRYSAMSHVESSQTGLSSPLYYSQDLFSPHHLYRRSSLPLLTSHRRQHGLPVIHQSLLRRSHILTRAGGHWMGMLARHGIRRQSTLPLRPGLIPTSIEIRGGVPMVHLRYAMPKNRLG